VLMCLELVLAGKLIPMAFSAFIGAFEEFGQFSLNARAFTWPDSGPTHCLGLSRAWALSRLILTKARLRPGLFGPTRLSTSLYKKRGCTVFDSSNSI
jgi:hypothetical protein